MKLYLLLIVFGLLIATFNFKDEAQRDHEKIRGTWKVVSAQDSGRDAPDEAIKNLKWIITKDKITYKLGAKNTALSFVLDPAKNPKWIDLTEVVEGEEVKPSVGIYELKGDDLKICYPEAGNVERSTAFESKADSVNDIFIILKREKP